MALIYGIISFPSIFTPKTPKGSDVAKYSCSVLIPAGDPQIADIQGQVEQAKRNSFPSGYTGANECFEEYDKKYAGKDYYDPRFSGWWVFSCSSKETDKPSVVDMDHNPIIDPGSVRSGVMVHVHAGISGYTKGRGGIGGWLNGVMVTGEMGEMGDLSGKPSVEGMFAGVASAPRPPAAPGAPAPAPAPVRHMLPAANGATYESLIAAGWTDDMLVAKGMMVAPAPQF